MFAWASKTVGTTRFTPATRIRTYRCKRHHDGTPIVNTVAVSYATSDRGRATDSESGPTDPAEPEASLPKAIALLCSHVFHRRGQSKQRARRAESM
jgi:hypothetical protein